MEYILHIFYVKVHILTNQGGVSIINMDKKLKHGFIIATYCFILLFCMRNVDSITGFCNTLIGLLSPFIVGFVLAFLLKGLLNLLETKVFTFEKSKNFKMLTRFKRAISMVFTYFIVITILVLLSIIVIPQLTESVQVLFNELPNHYKTFKTILIDFIENLRFSQEFWMSLWLKVEELSIQLINEAGKMLYNMLPSVIDFTKSVGSSLSSVFFGFIISIYMLYNKEKLESQVVLLLTAVLPMKMLYKVLKVGRMCNKAFSSFIVGQLTEACILGILCFIGMTIFKMPYAVLVSIIIGASNVIPIFGPIIGTIPATFIVLMANPTEPMSAVWFVVLVLIIQRIDNDIIYPKVIGNSIGLSGLWVIFAILIGGGLWGLTGMIVGVPLFAVIYQLVKEFAYTSLSKKHMKKY